MEDQTTRAYKLCVIDSFKGEFAFLSNFYPCRLEYDGVAWGTSEQAYQAAKCLDAKDVKAIRSTNSPGVAKKIGGSCRRRADWEAVKVSIMRNILKAKFSDKILAEQLIATGDAELQERNSHFDAFWGLTKDEDGDWRGANHLGKLLMEIRKGLVEVKASQPVQEAPQEPKKKGKA